MAAIARHHAAEMKDLVSRIMRPGKSRDRGKSVNSFRRQSANRPTGFSGAAGRLDSRYAAFGHRESP